MEERKDKGLAECPTSHVVTCTQQNHTDPSGGEIANHIVKTKRRSRPFPLGCSFVQADH
ncbi:hypothetical protein C8035_v004107 [Colletotrichum spinosum]|uniref:Uncharacterized protein n=1 Tax=Colletotrichum spinosum TaxID=1347390 RepID=A0A4R8QN02_9PEZI|nr:hypothetical protein C8035_v004107 [Colletotrichum spinosum]